MKRLVVLVTLISSFHLKAQEKYFLISDSSDSESAYQLALKSNDFLILNMETGLVSGVFSGGKYNGVFDILRTSSGFIKGFNYGMALGFLQRDVPASKAFDDWTMSLARSTKFYFYPDMLVKPKWDFLEISGSTYNKIYLVKEH
ncbi:MAG: hypothetical protein ACI9IP_001953 [Arcticibacterium sp.]|jgi:hypothetical protein